MCGANKFPKTPPNMCSYAALFGGGFGKTWFWKNLVLEKLGFGKTTFTVVLGPTGCKSGIE
jgi:hypothetical protein